MGISNKPQKKGKGNRVEDQRFGGLTPAAYWEKVFGCETGQSAMVKRRRLADSLLEDAILEAEENLLP